VSDWDTTRRSKSKVSSGAPGGPTSVVAFESKWEVAREGRGDGVDIWVEESDIGPSSSGTPDWFTLGLADVWGAVGSGLTASGGTGKDTVSGTKKGVAVAIFLAGRDTVPWLDEERMPVPTINDVAEGSVVPCNGPTAVL
jgi:hypothetical protein